MNSTGKHAGEEHSGSKIAKTLSSQNRNPNISSVSTPPIKKSSSKNPSPKFIASSKNKITKKKLFNRRGDSEEGECKRVPIEDEDKKEIEIGDCLPLCEPGSEETVARIEMVSSTIEDEGKKEVEIGDCLPLCEPSSEEIVARIEMASSTIKRSRERVLEEARLSVPELRSGHVMDLVEAFEKLVSVASCDDKEVSGNNRKWTFSGLQPNVGEANESMSSFGPSDLCLTSENLGLDSSVVSSWESIQGSFAVSNRTSGGGRRSRRNSIGSCGMMGGSRWTKKQARITTKKPFKLRTEQRGRLKEEALSKKIEKMMEEQERQRIPVALGLPWTTDEPECLVKPPVKDITRPVDPILHSDMRAIERAEFDQQVSEKLVLIEEFKAERERQQQIAEEEEAKKLRKELIPKAQPMPYFDRPFIPRRSTKHHTVPKEPNFHIAGPALHKKIKCSSYIP